MELHINIPQDQQIVLTDTEVETCGCELGLIPC